MIFHSFLLVVYVPAKGLTIVALGNMTGLDVDAAVNLALHSILNSSGQVRRSSTEAKAFKQAWLGVYRDVESGSPWVLSSAVTHLSLSSPGVEFLLKLSEEEGVLVSREGASDIQVRAIVSVEQRRLDVLLGDLHISLSAIIPDKPPVASAGSSDLIGHDEMGFAGTSYRMP